MHSSQRILLLVAVAASFISGDFAPAPAAQRRAAEADRRPLHEIHRATAGRLIGAALASDVAHRRLSELCDGIGHRLSGSATLDSAIAWAAATMRADKLDRVWLQPVRVPHWERGIESAVMTAPRRVPLAMLGLGRSVGTPPGGLEAEVIVVDRFEALAALPDDAVRGRIVLFNVPFTTYGATVRYRSLGAQRAAAKGAVAALVRSVGPPLGRTPHTGSMASYVDSIPKIPGAAISVEDAMMIDRLVARGERVRVRLEMSARTHPDALSHNVIGEIRGREKPDEIVVIGGHLDTWDVGSGAHDDGGGCVISMEALRLIRSLGLKPRRTLRCVLWTNEENGIAGGRAYADSSDTPPARHVAALESDGGVERIEGFDYEVRIPGTTRVDSVRTALAMARAREIAPLLAGLGADTVGPRGEGADIGPLMAHGVPGIAHRTTMERYFLWHHTSADMVDKVDPVELRKNVAAMAVMAWVLADMEEPLAGPNPPRPEAARP